jgi:hypothetical protein
MVSKQNITICGLIREPWQNVATMRNQTELPSEGRGHSFESCRALIDW